MYLWVSGLPDLMTGVRAIKVSTKPRLGYIPGQHPANNVALYSYCLLTLFNLHQYQP